MDSKPFSISPYLDIVYRHRRLSVGIVAVGLTVTLCVTLLLRDVYMASAVIMIEPPRVASNYVSMATDRGESPKLADQLEGLAQKAFTDAWLDDLVRRLGLYHVKEQLLPQNGSSVVQLIKFMRRKISVVVPPDTIQWEAGHPQGSSPVILTISFEYPDRFVAQRVTSELARRFIEQGQEDKSAQAADATRFLQTQVAQARAKLDQKAEEKRQLEQRFAGSLPEDLPANLGELDRLEGQIQIINERLAANPLAPAEGLTTLTPEQQLASLNLKLTHLRAEFSDEYPDVKELKSEIADLEAQISSRPAVANERPVSQTVGGAATARLERQAAAYSEKIQILHQNIALAPAHGQEVAAVNRDYEAISSEYHQLLDKQLAAELHQNLQKRQQDERLRLLNPVDLPKAPMAPNRLAVAALGLIVSMALALAAPFGLFFTDTSFKNPEELELEYGIPVAAAIPVVDEPMENRRATIHALIATCASVLLVAAATFAYAQWFRS